MHIMAEMASAPFVGCVGLLLGAVGRIARTQKWFLLYAFQPWYHISVYQSKQSLYHSIGLPKYIF